MQPTEATGGAGHDGSGFTVARLKSPNLIPLHKKNSHLEFLVIYVLCFRRSGWRSLLRQGEESEATAAIRPRSH